MPSSLGSYITMDDRNLVFSKYWLISEKRIILKWLKNTDEEVQTTKHKINKLQKYITQHREFSQLFIITVNGI